MSPTVSVCMPTYNQAKYLPEAIESVLRQTFLDFELLIIDDRSTDNSADIIQSYSRRDQRIRFLVNEHNIGMVNNWNRCIEEASGEYIKFLFGDDVLASPAALARMVSVLESNDRIVLVASARNLIDHQSRVKNVISEYVGRSPCDGKQVIMDCLLDQQNRVGEPSVVLFRKRQAMRGFDRRYRQIVDLEMWFHVLEQGMFAYIHDPLCSFRHHDTQQTRFNLEQCLHIDEPHMLIQDYAGKPYVRFSRVMRAYMTYFPAYGLWKLYKKRRRISRKAARERMERLYGYPLLKFYAFLPVYRTIKYYLKYKKRFLMRYLAYSDRLKLKNRTSDAANAHTK
jgi:glycosyltransferase involved in cell wall biosynthesis